MRTLIAANIYIYSACSFSELTRRITKYHFKTERSIRLLEHSHSSHSYHIHDLLRSRIDAQLDRGLAREVENGSGQSFKDIAALKRFYIDPQKCVHTAQTLFVHTKLPSQSSRVLHGSPKQCFSQVHVAVIVLIATDIEVEVVIVTTVESVLKG
jgi:hypothetical protein